MYMTPKEQSFVNALAAQRNAALDAAANLQAEIVERDERIKELEAQLTKEPT